MDTTINTDTLPCDEDEGPTEEEEAAAFEARVRSEVAVQFQALRDEARALYGMVDGRPGVRSPREWKQILDRAGDEIGNGRFIVRCLGAERYLDALTVAVLITLRQGLIAEKSPLTTADVMRIDAAVLGYYNMVRVQGWIGNLALVVERMAFGEEPLNEIHGPTVGAELEEQLRRLSETMLPLLERSNRMMIRNLPGSRSS